MVAEPNLTYKYQCGGTLGANAPYVERKADQELLEMLKSGEFCYVLNSRQMGKSSLRVKTMKKLEENQFACVTIDLSYIGNKNVNQKTWYSGLFYELSKKLNVLSKDEAKNWWNQHNSQSFTHRLFGFIEDLLLVKITEKRIVIFIDEIDNVLGLKFNFEDFFAFIRACYNRRAENHQFERLSFALFGVAKPSDLIRDENHTPFNIGHAIELTGFKLQEATPLAKGLDDQTSNSYNVLKEIIYWTGGQPFLTHLICDLIFKSKLPIAEGEEQKEIEKFVRREIIDCYPLKDYQSHFKTIRDRIASHEKSAGNLLALYRKILQLGEIEIDDSDEQIELQLSGLVVKHSNKLTAYNLIYKDIFNLDWIENELKKIRPYAEEIKAWLASDRQDQTQLLYGQKLLEALTWAKDINLSKEDNDFLQESRLFEQQSKFYLPENSNHEAVIRAGLSWTSGQRKLNDKIFRLIPIFKEPLKAGSEASWVEKLVLSHLIENWENQEAAEPLRTIRDRLLDNNRCAPFRLLTTYQQIWQQREVIADDSQEQLELLQLGLVVNQQGQLRVANRLYESVFNLSWLDRALMDLRPYAQALAAWESGNCQDESQLLGQLELQEAIEWTADKNQSLKSIEHKFLITSQVFSIAGKLEEREREVIKSVERWIGKVSKPQVFLREVLFWTGGQKFYTQKLCQLICAAKNLPAKGEEAIWVEQLVRTELIEKFAEQVAAEPVKMLLKQIDTNQDWAFKILEIYRQILQNKSVAADGSSEQTKLLQSDLVVNHQGYLNVHNRIYELVFNLSAVEQGLASLRPYAETLVAWESANGQDKSYLLRGQALQEALTWVENKWLWLNPQERKFIIASQVWDMPTVQIASEALQNEAMQTAIALLEKVSYPQAMIKEILFWTNGQPALTQRIFQLVRDSDAAVPQGGESAWIKQLVQTRLIENWETQLAAEHLRMIRDRIFADRHCAFQLLESYQQILQQGEVLADDSSEQNELLQLGLVDHRQERLSVHNPIYKNIFNQNWVNQELTYLRPYAQALAAWSASNCDDKSQLLRGQALKEALAWAEGKRLKNEREYQFLTASKVWNLPEIQRAPAALQSEAIQTAQQLSGKTSNPLTVIRAVLSLTNSQLILTQKIFQLVLTAESAIPKGSEALWVQQLVRTRLIQNWETQVAAEHLRAISARIFTSGQSVTKVLRLYEQILQQGEVVANDSLEQFNLLQLELIVKQQGKLKVANRIYPAIFNLSWVQKALAQMPQAEIPSGTVINNRYLVKKVLGQGGFGRTYLVNDNQRFDEPFVLKEFLPNNIDELVAQKSRELFEREARVLHQIDHPQIPKFMAWLEEKGRLFLVQEYIDGKTYYTLLRERQKQGQCFSEAEIMQWLEELLPVLEYIHAKNIIHRDISPDNIMLSRALSRPVLIDFGSVKHKLTQLYNTSPEGSSNTSQVSFVGKDGFAPHEQIHWGQCSPNSDIYALGVTAIVLLTGERPNSLLDRNSLELQWHSYVSVSEQLAQIIDKMLAVIPKNRYQSAQEVLNDLRLLRKQPLETEQDQAKKVGQVAEAIEIIDTELQQLSSTKNNENLAAPSSPEVQIPGDRHPNSLIFQFDDVPSSRVGAEASNYGQALPDSDNDETIPEQQASTHTPLPPPPSEPLTWICDKTFTSHTERVVGVAFSPDGQILASLGYENTRSRRVNTVKTWNLSTGKKESSYPLPAGSYRSIVFNSDHQILVSAILPQKITIFNLQTKKQTCSLAGRMEGVTCLAFTANGQRLVSGSKDGTIKLWDLQTGSLSYTLPGRLGAVRCLGSSPDGRTIVLVNWENTIIIVHLDNHRQLLRLNEASGKNKGNASFMARFWPFHPHNVPVNAVAISPNKWIVASGGDDKKVTLWNVRPEEQVRTLPRHSSRVVSVAFSPNGQALASSTQDGEIIIWRCSPTKSGEAK
ncbi:MAG TPA: hypothetical protein DC064_24200 [Cyanobacteria bacterium UBA9273]|nr:hypothetical protein [Cyanobacteria bacterium UBA9273]